jgi:hypothetical protein
MIMWERVDTSNGKLTGLNYIWNAKVSPEAASTGGTEMNDGNAKFVADVKRKANDSIRNDATHGAPTTN